MKCHTKDPLDPLDMTKQTLPRPAFLLRVHLGALCGVLFLLWAAPALAEDEQAPEQEAQSAFDRAVKLSEAHRYAEAVKELEGAAAMDPTPPILLNLGRMREETGDTEGAMRAYRELLTRNRRSRLRGEAETRLHALEAKAKAHPPEPKAPEPTPPPVAPPVAPAIVQPSCPPCLAATAPAPEARPLHKRWWFWAATVGGAVVVVGAAVGITAALTRTSPPPAPSTDLGNMRFFLP